jgi:DNA repair exonuclease SbcCD ATPase subunit
MKKIFFRVIGPSMIALLLIVPVLSVRAETEDTNTSEATQIKTEQARESAKQVMEQARESEKQRLEQIRESEKQRLEQIRENEKNKLENRVENLSNKFDNRFIISSTTKDRLENRENNIERIKARLASTTASTSAKRVEKLNDRLQKQEEQMAKAKDRLLNRELKIADTLGKIASKIQDRIKILATNGVDVTVVQTKLDEATVKIENLIAETARLATLIQTPVTDANADQLEQGITASQKNVRGLANIIKNLLLETVKE